MAKVCKRGHPSSALPGGRYVMANGKPGTCKECQTAQGAKWRAENRECCNAYAAKWNAENPERVRAARAKRHAENRESANAQNAKWRAANAVHEKEMTAKWARENRGKCNAILAVRRARTRRQTCTCCTPSEIRGLYMWAAELGCDVDHKHALALGGLHCLKNLQILTPEEHKIKTAHWDAPLIATARRLPA